MKRVAKSKRTVRRAVVLPLVLSFERTIRQGLPNIQSKGYGMSREQRVERMQQELGEMAADVYDGINAARAMMVNFRQILARIHQAQDALAAHENPEQLYERVGEFLAALREER